MHNLLTKLVFSLSKKLGLYTYNYPRPAITCDIVYLTSEHDSILQEVEVLLIRRKNAPFKGCWALPGGFMNINETLVDAAKRELFEETGISTNLRLDFQCMRDTIDRDERSRVLTAVFCIEDYGSRPEVKAGDDASDYRWVKLSEIMDVPLAFDHRDILRNVCWDKI